MTTFTIGQRVQWPHITQRGRLTEMTTRYGVVLSISDHYATIKQDGNKRKITVPLSDLRPERSTTAVNDFVQEVFRRNREAQDKP